jgi:DNA-directed RNA polymerase subunit K
MSEKNSIPYISKYELAALISERAKEIANNNPITIKNPKSNNPIDIAMQEYEEGKLPKKIKRIYPNGKIEIWSINNFIKN